MSSNDKQKNKKVLILFCSKINNQDNNTRVCFILNPDRAAGTTGQRGGAIALTGKICRGLCPHC